MLRSNLIQGFVRYMFSGGMYMFSILSSKKNFNDYWVGHKKLNSAGLHESRLLWGKRLSNCRKSIRNLYRHPKQPALIEKLQADGYIAIENFLPDPEHEALSREINTALERLSVEVPIQENAERGFGSKRFFRGGFDRFDGGTLNRFVDIHSKNMPVLSRLAEHPVLTDLSLNIVGRAHQARKTKGYLIIHGEEKDNLDPQKEFHRDTFFPAMKFWYFPEEVKLEDGPFIYVPGSHLLTPERMQWERETAINAIDTQEEPNVGGSFRISMAEIERLNLPDPVTVTCPPNTLVVANVFGFHRRGNAEVGRRRLSVYGWQRPSPFSPI